jgi:uncharacterized repeat protein (TIGR01451 family)
MDRRALHDTIHTASRRRRWRALVACLLLAALWAAAAPVFAQARSFARRFPAPAAQPLTVRGDIALIGNTSLSCPGTCAAQNGTGRNNGTQMTEVDVDADGTTTNSSTATLNLPAGSTVLFAGLYWAGQTGTASARNSVRLRTPSSASYATISATTIDDINNAYQSFADITSIVASSGNGAYTVANVALTPGDGQWAGWTLVVAYQNVSGDLRNLSVFDGFQLADGANPIIDVSVSGFITPPAPAPVNSDIGLVTYDGDRGQNDAGSSTASLQFGPTDTNLTSVSNTVNTVFDVFNSTISVRGTNVTAGRVPSYTNTLGIDVDVFRPNTPLPNESTSLVARIRGSSGDVNYPGIMTIATDVFEPEVVTNFSKSAADDNGAPFRPGDTVTYTVNVANTGNDDAQIVVVTDPLPTNVTFVPGSIVVTSGPNAGPKTDASGDDQAEFNGTQVVFRAGDGADASNGGVLKPSPTPTADSATSIEFKVTIDADVANGTSIANVATIGFRSATTGIPGTGSTPPASFVVANEADLRITKTNTPASGPVDGSDDTVVAGAPTSYQIVITNAGPNAANNAAVRDPAATGLTCTDAACDATNGATCPAQTGPALVSALQSSGGAVIPTMPVGGVATITLTCNVAP